MAEIASEYQVPQAPYKCTVKELKQEFIGLDCDKTADAALQAAFLENATEADKYYYGVSIMNAKLLGAGTPSPDLFIRLIGKTDELGEMYLQYVLSLSPLGSTSHQDMRPNDSKLIFESSGDLGEISSVIISSDESSLNLNSLYSVNVRLFNDKSVSKPLEAFLCNLWPGSGDATQTTTVNHIQEESHLAERKRQLQKRCNEYVWRRFPNTGLPSGIKARDTIIFRCSGLPPDEIFGWVKYINFTSTIFWDSLKIFRAIGDITKLEDYEKLATILGASEHEVPIYNPARWKTDVEFGRQILNGVNPVVIERCTILPPNFPVTTDMVKVSLNRGKTLEEEMKEGHVYICDLKIMEGLLSRKGQHCTAPICLLYVNGDNQLVPIAIQLKQKASEDNPIFLPDPSDHDWLLAKIYYQSAHLQFHQLSTHYYSCHAAMEAYAVATMRNLPGPHPIYKLLHPHFRYTMAINTLARATLINDGGIIDQLFAIGGKGKVELLQRVSKLHQVQWTNIVQHAKERGVDDPDKLPGYYYRDDGTKIWNAIKKFVEGIVDEFYSTDEDVQKDTEIQSWAEDVHKNGFPGYFGAEDGHGFPKKITTKQDLVEICTLIMFTGSAQHASVNFGQYGLYGFVPNAPSTLCLPPPSKRGVADYNMLMKTLPNKTDTTYQIKTAHLLSGYSPDEKYLGDYPPRIFPEETPRRLIKEFQDKLADITVDIKERNKDRDVPYAYMMPEKIPNSITI